VCGDEPDEPEGKTRLVSFPSLLNAMYRFVPTFGGRIMVLDKSLPLKAPSHAKFDCSARCMGLPRSQGTSEGKHTAMNSAIHLRIDELLGISQLQVPKRGCWTLPRLRKSSCGYTRRNSTNVHSFLPKPLPVDRSWISPLLAPCPLLAFLRVDKSYRAFETPVVQHEKLPISE
jgi:hypothetical protein